MASRRSHLGKRTGRDERIVIGPREQIFHLLAEAAEIEHTLMCTYLYAAFSLKRGTGTGLSRAESKLVAVWRETLLSVATEEMVHLVLVSNISVALGGRPHLGRPNFPIAPGYFPSGVVVKLARFCKATLDHFVFLERPAEVALADGAGFAPPKKYRRESGRQGLMPSAQDYLTVGHLYEALAENLRASTARLGEKALFIGTRAAQIGPAVFDMPGVQEIDSTKLIPEEMIAVRVISPNPSRSLCAAPCPERVNGLDTPMFISLTSNAV